MTAKDNAATAVPLPASLDAALGRLTAALDRLQATAERQAEARAGRGDADDETALMQQDRAQLAEQLDAALSRAERLAGAHAAAIVRLDRAEATIRAVAGGLGTPDTGGEDS